MVAQSLSEPCRYDKLRQQRTAGANFKEHHIPSHIRQNNGEAQSEPMQTRSPGPETPNPIALTVKLETHT